MASSTLEDLPNLASPAGTDLLYVVADPAGTPTPSKSTIDAVVAAGGGGGGGGDGGGTIVNESRPNVTVTNTIVETDVYSVSIPGGTLGTAGRLQLFLVSKKVKNGGGTDSAMTMRVYFGGTQIGADLLVPPVTVDSANGNSLILTVQLLAAGATNAQIGHTFMSAQIDQSSGVGVRAGYGTAAIDTTVDAIFKVTWQQGGVPQHSFTSEYGLITVFA